MSSKRIFSIILIFTILLILSNNKIGCIPFYPPENENTYPYSIFDGHTLHVTVSQMKLIFSSKLFAFHFH